MRFAFGPDNPVPNPTQKFDVELSRAFPLSRPESNRLPVRQRRTEDERNRKHRAAGLD